MKLKIAVGIAWITIALASCTSKTPNEQVSDTSRTNGIATDTATMGLGADTTSARADFLRDSVNR